MLFTDIVGSTKQATEIGDRLWRQKLDEYDALVQRQLDRFRGRKVKSTGDGTLAAFDGPARAVRCASAIRGRCRVSASKSERCTQARSRYRRRSHRNRCPYCIAH